ncbi:unnamed protein product [Paramecium pentaurelia]|uniref:Mini antigen n=1 Tax=Paramecium pentaurelia TaxID=43138 RepID=A0A8S1T0T7_9CILI|nr:unnamed protein product [Paramecium pentaurelia]
MKISIMLLLVAISAIGNAYFIPNVKCACQQILIQSECNNWNCQWNQVTPATATTPATGYCQQATCGTLNQEQCKNESERCYYQEPGPNPTTSQVCYEFSKCEDIILSNGTTCQKTNPKCVASPPQLQPKFQCISAGLTCSGLSLEQCSPPQSQTLAGEGLCYWNGNSCKVVSQCSELTTITLCQMKKFQNACQWVGSACIALTCASFTTQDTCTFYQQATLSSSPIQICNWTGTNCIPATPQMLQSSNCGQNTNNHYRWVPMNASSGICAQCNPYKYVFRNQCECKQLLQANECTSSKSCTWIPPAGTTPGYCQPTQCTSFADQQTCAQVQGCYWNINAQSPGCQTFSTCSNIVGQNAQICYSQSIYCPGSNGTNCQSQQQLNSCATIVTPMQPNVCFNSIGKDGYCTYEGNQCVSVKQCSQLTTLQLCNQFSNSCVWKTGSQNSCQSKTCQDYLTESSCTYIQNNINNNIINVCTWNPDTKKCSSFDNSFSYDVNSCFNSTGRTHHWSEPSNAQKGFCLPCHYSSVLNVKSNCSCSDLTNYTDCALSSPKCYWNAASSTCSNQNCPQLTSQGQCVLSKYCYWSNSQGCQPLGSSSTTCSTLTANTQQECLSQSILCAGISSNGKCQSSPNSCGDFTTFYQCFGSVGTDGICQWNQTSLKCQGISSCNMINTSAQCELVLNTCYWGNSGNGTNTCMPYNCTTLYTQTQSCNFYLSTPNQNYEVKYCQLNGQTCADASNLSSLTSSNCYASSGGTARWDADKGNGTCVQCYAQIISVLFIILSYMF